MKSIDKFWTIFDRTIAAMMAVSSALIVLIAIAVTIDVLMRYIFSKTYAGLFEITEYSLLWITFLGAPWIMKNNGHVRVDLIVNRLAPRKRASLKIIADFISIFLLITMTWYTAGLTLHDFRTSFTLSGVLMAPKWPIEIIIPIGFFLLLLQMARHTRRHVEDLKALPADAFGKGGDI